MLAVINNTEPDYGLNYLDSPTPLARVPAPCASLAVGVTKVSLAVGVTKVSLAVGLPKHRLA